MRKRIEQNKEISIKVILAFVSVLLVFSFVYLKYYSPYRKKIERSAKGKSALRKIPTENDLRALLGYFSIGKQSGFLNFPQDKSPGKIRIGCFGCSFTYGAEVGPADDYPSQLQKFYEQAGMKNVEVINFGSSGYGFNQSYLLYEKIGKKYGLDYIVIGPAGFYDYRERTFNNANDEYSSSLHARYIVTREGVSLLSVLGKTTKEQRALYFRFLPVIYYLRYDVFPQAIIRCIARKGWSTIKNPFYYFKGAEQNETDIIYRELLSKMSRNSELKRIYVINHDRRIISLCRDLHAQKISAAYVSKPNDFPNIAPWGHYSSHGNDYLAHKLFDWIEFGIMPSGDIIAMQVKNIDQNRLAKIKFLNQYKQVSIIQNNRRIASIIQFSNIGRTFSYKPIVREKMAKKSLVIVQQKDLINAIWIETDQQFIENEKIIIKLYSGIKCNSYFLGNLKMLATNIGTFKLPGVFMTPLGRQGENKIFIFSLVTQDGKKINIMKDSQWELLIGDEIVMSSKGQNKNEYLCPMVMENDFSQLTFDPVYLQFDNKINIPLVTLTSQ